MCVCVYKYVYPPYGCPCCRCPVWLLRALTLRRRLGLSTRFGGRERGRGARRRPATIHARTVYIHIYVYVCTFMCIYIHIYVYMCVCMYVYIYIYRYICICIYVYLYIYIDTCTYNVYIYMPQTYTHTHVQSLTYSFDLHK